MKVTVLDRLEGTTYRRKFWNETKEFGFYCFLCGGGSDHLTACRYVRHPSLPA